MELVKMHLSAAEKTLMQSEKEHMVCLKNLKIEQEMLKWKLKTEQSINTKDVRTSRSYCKGKRKPEMPRYIVDGFVFHVNIIKGSPPMTYLRCLEYKRLGCHARAVIPNNGTINDIKLKRAHNHPPDYAAEEKIVFLRELKDVMLKNDNISSKEVYDLLSPLYPNAARETTFESIKGKMYRWRRLTEADS